jgi:Bacterial capsule synthesis protein PGA_cap
MLVWKDQHRAPVCRFGITGDFLPASGLSPVGGETWSEKGKLVAPLFQDLQFSVVNLECPVGVEGIAPKAKASLGDSFATRTESLEYLDSLKLSVVAIANNHLYDYGKAGAERTLLNVQGKFSVCGFGRTLQEPPSVCIREVAESIRVGIWAAARNLPDAATHNSMGIEPATRERAAQALAYMAGCNVHCHVAFLHAGAEGTNYPDPEDAEFMVELAEMGFDVVAACHSHRISGYKTVRGKNGAPGHCLFGLGSLSSGVLYSLLEHEGILAAISLDASGAVCELDARPICLDERGWGAVPSTQQHAAILERFQKVSASIQDGSYRQTFYRDVSRDLMGTQWRDVRVAFQRAGLRGIWQKLIRLRPAHVRRLYHKSLASIGLD